MTLTLGEVKRNKLKGYELKTGYVLVLKHGLMGTFPALISENEELFVCTDKQLLEKVWEKIKKRPATVLELQLYVNETEGKGFDVGVGDCAESITVLSEERFNSLIEKHKEPFKWASGLFFLTAPDAIPSPFI